MSISYADQLKQYKSFSNPEEFKKAFNLYRQKYRFEINEAENKVLFTMTGYARKYLGACKIQLESLAKASGVSVSTVRRAIKKACDLGIIKIIKTRKDGGRRQGSNVYQFQHFEHQLEHQTMNNRENNRKPCDSKINGPKNNAETPVFINPSLESLKDTKATKGLDKLKIGLLEKLPKAIREAIEPFFDSIDDIYRFAGAVFNGKRKIDKSVRIEDHQDLYYSSITSVIESWKRSMRKNKPFNVFAVMCKAAEETTASIADGTAYAPQEPIRRVNKFYKSTSRKVENVPDWLKRTPEEKVAIEVARKKEQENIDFEKAQAQFLARLAKLNS